MKILLVAMVLCVGCSQHDERSSNCKPCTECKPCESSPKETTATKRGTFTSGIAFAHHLSQLVTCKSRKNSNPPLMDCFLNFRGLGVEFSAMNQKGGGEVIITKIGNQEVMPISGRCIQARFRDKDLWFPVPSAPSMKLSARIWFRNDGKIMFALDQDAKCE